MNPLLKAPGTMLLKLSYDGPLSIFAFKINLRRYIVAFTSTRWNSLQKGHPQWNEEPPTVADCMAGVYTRPLSGST